MHPSTCYAALRLVAMLLFVRSRNKSRQSMQKVFIDCNDYYVLFETTKFFSGISSCLT